MTAGKAPPPAPSPTTHRRPRRPALPPPLDPDTPAPSSAPASRLPIWHSDSAPSPPSVSTLLLPRQKGRNSSRDYFDVSGGFLHQQTGEFAGLRWRFRPASGGDYNRPRVAITSGPCSFVPHLRSRRAIECHYTGPQHKVTSGLRFK